MFRNCSTFAAFALVAMLAAAADAQAPTSWTQVGMLNCRLNPSVGFIIAGHQSMECRYVPSEGGPPQLMRALSIRWVSTSVSVLAECLVGRSLHRPAAYQQVRWLANTSAHLEILALVSVRALTS